MSLILAWLRVCGRALLLPFGPRGGIGGYGLAMPALNNGLNAYGVSGNGGRFADAGTPDSTADVSVGVGSPACLSRIASASGAGWFPDRPERFELSRESVDMESEMDALGATGNMKSRRSGESTGVSPVPVTGRRAVTGTTPVGGGPKCEGAIYGRLSLSVDVRPSGESGTSTECGRSPMGSSVGRAIPPARCTDESERERET